MGPDPFKDFLFFGHFSVRFSLLNHHISSPGTSENHRKTCSERSWVHMAYPYPRNTSENRRSFSPPPPVFVSQFVPKIHLPEMGFPASFGKFPEIGRKTHFRQIKFALNGVGKPISGQSIPIRGQTQGLSMAQPGRNTSPFQKVYAIPKYVMLEAR